MVLGVSFIERLADADGRPIDGHAHLSGLAVDPSRWGEGLATKVMAQVESVARERGYRHIHLHVLEDDARARRLYEHLGWMLDSVGHPHSDGPRPIYEMDLP